MLEGLTDLLLLATQADHLGRMKYAQAAGEKRFLDRMLESPELSASQRVMLEGRLAECMARYQPLHNEFRGDKRPQVDDFALAGLKSLVGPYSMLCSFAHNDLTALAYRHQGERGMTYREPVPEDTTFLLLSHASFVVMRAMGALKSVVYLPDGRFDHHQAEIGRLYDAITGLAPAPSIESESPDNRERKA
ncbi:hypothetical protein LR961_02725 [Stenotrophomonas sp. SY1]|nr:hypothetical protein [Stenotrophomonas sp. SY1]MCD9085681.1 hypothetical protein [Stenotrophomonas sp. SY1]